VTGICANALAAAGDRRRVRHELGLPEGERGDLQRGGVRDLLERVEDRWLLGSLRHQLEHSGKLGEQLGLPGPDVLESADLVA
jgi:hypothetical protein